MIFLYSVIFDLSLVLRIEVSFAFARERLSRLGVTTVNEKKHPVWSAFPCFILVGEFAPPYKASVTEAAEQCFEPHSRDATILPSPAEIVKRRASPSRERGSLA